MFCLCLDQIPTSASPRSPFFSIPYDKMGCKEEWSSWSSVLVVLVVKDYKFNLT